MTRSSGPKPPDPPEHGDAQDSFARLVSLMYRLRAPGGCPWDAEQTHRSIKHYLIEEAYEAVEAIEDADDAGLRDELGDVLLQVVFHAEMAAERGAFSIEDVIAGLCAKLTRRHPHVFGDTVVRSSADVVTNWERIKSEEKGGAEAASALDGVPRGLPALLRAHRFGEKAAVVGFDWGDADGVRKKLDEELGELDAALAREDHAGAAAELGDVVFTAASLARKLGFNAEVLLGDALRRFEQRFRDMESEASALGTPLKTLDSDELQRAWDRAKQREKERAR